MEDSVKRLIRQSGLYALGNIAVKASGLLLAPLYLNTALLSEAAYGQLILLETTAQVAIPIAGLGLGTAMLKFLTDPAYAEHEDRLPFTTLVLSAVLALAACGLLWLAAPLLGSFLLDDAGATALPHLVAVYVGFKIVGAVPYVLIRTEERAGLYTLALVAEWAVLVGGVYYFLAVQAAGLYGVLQAYVLSAGVSAAVLVGGMLWRVPWRFHGRLVGRLVRFGVPLVLSAFAGLFLNVGDRYLLKWFADAEAVAIYGWGAKMGGVINMLFVQSFQLAFTVIGLKTIGAGDLSLYRRTFRHYTIWTGWAVLGLSLLSYDAMALMVAWFGVGDNYLAAVPLVLPIALGFMAYGLYVVVNNILYATELTHVIGTNVLLAAALNALLNLALIPLLGGMGAALTTYVAFLGLAVLSARIAERRIHVGYPWRVYVLTVVAVLGLYLLGMVGQDWDLWARVALRVGLIIAYLPLIVVLRLYEREHLVEGRAKLAALWRKLRAG